MGKGTIEARKINWLRLFLVKGSGRPDPAEIALASALAGGPDLGALI